jgi:hypothetical protein
MTMLRWIVRITTLVVITALVWGFAIEPATLRVKADTLHLRHWPQPQAGLRIALFADLHPGAPFINEDKIRAVVAMTNATHPDLIAIAGDIFHQNVMGGRTITPEATARILSHLRAPLGVYAVMGNHDHALDTVYLGAQLHAAGIHVIDERAVRIHSGRFQFWMVGFGDLTTGMPNVSLTLSGVTDDAPIIALTHNPDLFPAIPARVNLVLAGHMHGGQVWIPGIGRPVFWRPDFYHHGRYSVGHVVEQTDLFVTTGIGTSHLPVRFLVPPEISLLTLEP